MKLKLILLAFVLFSFTAIYGQTEPVLKGCHMVMPDYEPVPGYTGFVEPDTRSDTMDILDYHIRIDVSVFDYLTAHTTISAAAKVDQVAKLTFDLLDLQVDSILHAGQKIDFSYDGFKIQVPLATALNTGESIEIDVFYQGTPTIDPGNFGGLTFDSGYIYNLGIGISSNPHNFGRGWFPCFDNFVERSTYTYEVTHNSNLIAHCVGTELGTEELGNNLTRTTYQMSQQIPTYLSGIAIANYHTIWSEYEGIASTYPIKLISRKADSTNMKNAFGNLPQALEALESWYGPYVWERVGYVITTVGAMEHPTNIAYPASSISGGNADANTRLMSHELAHHWWGNLVTLSTEGDMWIKEGNAEYGYHLTAEHIYGEEEFRDVVRTNHAVVINGAHKDDDGFRALSGMPNEYTYGTTTYNKGASVMHNLRGYMGDELFKQGMNSILQAFEYGHLNAEQFRDQLELSTGLDMDPFFNAWIFEGGFAAFVIDSINYQGTIAGINTYTVDFQQKLFGTEKFHQEVPVSLDIIGVNGEEQQMLIHLSGQYDQAQIETDFEVKRIITNRDNLLNISRLDVEQIVEQDGTASYARAKLNIKFEGIEEPFWTRVEHVFGSPDQNPISPDYTLNTSRYWDISGDFPDTYSASTTFKYEGKKLYDLDYDFLQSKEDSLLLFYRVDASQAWAPVPEAQLITFIPGDGEGQFNLDDVKPGQYCIGKGVLDDVSVKDYELAQLNIYPNPADDVVYIQTDVKDLAEHSMSVFNNLGQLVDNKVFDHQNNAAQYHTSHLVNGQYFIQIKDKDHALIAVQKLSIQRGE